MTWTRLDENFYDHPKVVAAGPDAEHLHIRGLIYSNRYLLNGRLPKLAVGAFSPFSGRRAERAIERLIEVGIWQEVKDAYEIHDYLIYQPSREQVQAQRKQKASAGQAGGQARARRLLQAEPKQTPSRTQAESKPVSVPVPQDSFTTSLHGDSDMSVTGVQRTQRNGQPEQVRDILKRVVQ